MDEMKNNEILPGDDPKRMEDLPNDAESNDVELNNLESKDAGSIEAEAAADVTEPEEQVHTSQEAVPTEENKYCVQCNSAILPGQEFCPKCGLKVGSQKSESKPEKAGGKKKLPIIIGAVAGIAAIIALIFIVRGVQAKSVTLNKDSLTIKVGESADLNYTINPDNTKNKTVEWKSSNNSIATVDNGKIMALNEGDCMITIATKNGKTDTCSIIVEPAGPDLEGIYNEFCDSTYAKIASDGSYLSIDTNPDNEEEYLDLAAIQAMYSVNEALGLPESVENKILSTRAMDGMQTYNGDGIEITWTYHPDSGLEIMYSISN